MKYIIIFFLYLISQQGIAQRKLTPIIVDTDCAADDLRCMSMLLSITELPILAICTDDGALSPEQGALKVKSLLAKLNLQNIPVAAGRQLTLPAPAWRNETLKINWGNEIADKTTENATTLLTNILTKAEQSIDLVCLGTLSNIYDIIKSKSVDVKKINKIIWYNSSIYPARGANYERDTSAANFLLKSDVRLDVISNLRKPEAIFDTTLLQQIKRINTTCAKAISESHLQKNVFQNVSSGHYGLWDDLIPVYLLYPNLFDMKPNLKSPNIQINVDYELVAVKRKIAEILANEYSLEKNVAFEKFPINKLEYQDDVQEIVEYCIKNYGLEEWKSNIVTNEIHGHLGVYSIVGSKMGILAREILGAEIDRLHVVSFAGNTPPYSCLNDGIQTSTGATLGLGYIEIAQEKEKRPEAIFSYNNKKIKIMLKPEYRQAVDNDLASYILQYGNLSNGYWKMVRKQAIKYWKEWSRTNIFEVEKL